LGYSVNIETLNNFYKKKICREIVLKLYKSKCQKCGEYIHNDWDVSHVFPRSKGDEFSKLVGMKINVDNLINLVPMHQRCNRSNGNRIIDNPMLLFNSLNYTQKIVEGRLHKVMKEPIIIAKYQKYQEITDYLYMAINFNYSFGKWITFADDEELGIDFCRDNNLEYEEHPIYNIERLLGCSVKKKSIEDMIIDCPKTVKLSNLTKNNHALFFVKKKTIIELYRSTGVI